jgi:hypothetical protein
MCHHRLMSTQDSRGTAVQYSLIHIQLRSWYCCDCFGECDIKGGSELVELHIYDTCYKEGSYFGWIRLAGCLHYKGIEDGIVRGPPLAKNHTLHYKSRT